MHHLQQKCFICHIVKAGSMLPLVASMHILFFIFVHSHLPTCANSNVTSRPKLRLCSTEAHIDFQLFKDQPCKYEMKESGFPPPTTREL